MAGIHTSPEAEFHCVVGIVTMHQPHPNIAQQDSGVAGLLWHQVLNTLIGIRVFRHETHHDIAA